MLKYLIYDTETTGLNIHTDKPFFVSYGFVDENYNLYRKDYFFIDLHRPVDKTNKQEFDLALAQTKTIVGHNIKFDVHMLLNIDYDTAYFENKNYIDTQILARLVINHDIQSDKSFRTGLKSLAVKYLGTDCNNEEKILKAELSSLIIKHKEGMLQYFIQQNVWDMSLNKTKTTVVINKIYNDWFRCFEQYSQLAQARKDYLQKFPTPTYADIKNVATYGLTDVKLTHGLFKLFYPQIPKLLQSDVVRRASGATYPLVVMEREGLVVDIQRVLRDREVLLREFNNTHIIDPRTDEELNVGQNAKLKELYSYESGEEVLSADKKARSYILNSSPAAAAAEYKSKLSKYINTYVARVLEEAVLVNGEYRMYSQYDMAGTITGRLSSNFQQFPKESLELNDGTTISIRSWFTVPKSSKYMFYFDYSQLELRLQCEWTAVINGEPDLNMARAFVPFKCTKRGDDYYLDEDPNIKWIPTDLHSLTAHTAFPNIDMNSPEWSHYRKLGKRCNFACNYGASAAKISSSLDVDMDTAKRLVDGYKHAFKGVVDFGNWLNNRVYMLPSIPNLFLRRYYSKNKHQLQNWLVQGSGADLLLIKLRMVYDYLKLHTNWHFMITVHDEIGFAVDDTPIEQLIKEIKDIKQIMYHKFSAIEIISDVEYTTTDWSEKYDWYEDKFRKDMTNGDIIETKI